MIYNKEANEDNPHYQLGAGWDKKRESGVNLMKRDTINLDL